MDAFGLVVMRPGPFRQTFQANADELGMIMLPPGLSSTEYQRARWAT
jgi:hypothetical protein